MMPDVLLTLAAVRDYLIDEALPILPQNMQGEMRAATKNIQDVLGEISNFNSRVTIQNRELQALVSNTLDSIKRNGEVDVLFSGGEIALADLLVESDESGIVALLAKNRELRMWAGKVVAALQDVVWEVVGADTVSKNERHALLANAYQILGKHAEMSAKFQSVFPLPAGL